MKRTYELAQPDDGITLKDNNGTVLLIEGIMPTLRVLCISAVFSIWSDCMFFYLPYAENPGISRVIAAVRLVSRQASRTPIKWNFIHCDLSEPCPKFRTPSTP